VLYNSKGKSYHFPVRIASTRAPSVNKKARPDSLAILCRSKRSAIDRKSAHESRFVVSSPILHDSRIYWTVNDVPKVQYIRAIA
jgi:hypothetical protein